MSKSCVDLLKKVGDSVQRNEPLYRVHAEFLSDYIFAQNLCELDNGYTIGKSEDISKAFVEF